VRNTWGSKKITNGEYECLFCEKFQSESEVFKRVEEIDSKMGLKEAQAPFQREKKSILKVALESGQDSAIRVFRFGTLFEKIGSILQFLNAFAAIVIAAIILFVDNPTSLKLIGILFVGLVWGLGFLQTSLIRGLASYFQMRSSEYLEESVDKSV
jgi:hypothetical protein